MAKQGKGKKRGRKPSVRCTSFRLANESLQKLDEIASRESERTGYRVTRTAILQKLIQGSAFSASREPVENSAATSRTVKPSPSKP